MQTDKNKNNDIDFIEPVPKLEKPACKIVSYALAWTLTLFPYIVAAIFFFLYDMFIAFVVWGISYLAIGIVRSKLRLLSIPFTQLEYNYNDTQIAQWYTAKYLCDKNFT